jgi:hypothetical protein
MDTRGGWVLRIPVHATVMIFETSIFPQVTITGGTGARRALPFHVILAIYAYPFFSTMQTIENGQIGVYQGLCPWTPQAPFEKGA